MTLDEIKELVNNGNLASADAELKTLVELEPENIQAKLLYGTCRLLLGDENVFRKIHDEVRPRMAFEKDVTIVLAWRKYLQWLRYLLVGALMLEGGCASKNWLECEEVTLCLYAGPPQNRLVEVYDPRRGFLIDMETDINTVGPEGKTPLANICGRICDDRRICINRHQGENLIRVVRILLENGADPNLGKFPPLFVLTASQGYSPYATEAVKLLLENGADVNVKVFNRTPLENAVTGIRDIELVKLLVENGATITEDIISRAERDPIIQKYLLEKSGKTEADIYPQRKSKVKFDGTPENKMAEMRMGTPSFRNDRSHKIHEEMERYMREVREFHENRKPGECFDHDRWRQIHDEHHRRMREL